MFKSNIWLFVLLKIWCILNANELQAGTREFSKDLLQLLEGSNQEDNTSNIISVYYDSNSSQHDFSQDSNSIDQSIKLVKYDNAISKKQNIFDCLKKPAFFSYENLHKAVDIAALLYVLPKMFGHYKTVYKNGDTTQITKSWFSLYKILDYISPNFIKTLGRHGHFLVGSTGIALETLVIKTAIKLGLLCGEGDLLTLAENGACRGKKFVANFLLC